MLPSVVILRLQPCHTRQFGAHFSFLAPWSFLISFRSIDLLPLCAPFRTQAPYFQSLAASFSKTTRVGVPSFSRKPPSFPYSPLTSSGFPSFKPRKPMTHPSVQHRIRRHYLVVFHSLTNAPLCNSFRMTSL